MPKIDQAARPFLKWAGGKRQLLKQIESRFPKNLCEYDTYIEPFVGGGAVLFHVLSNYDFSNVIAYDINPELILVYRMVKRSAEDVIRCLRELDEKYPAADKGTERKRFYYDVRNDWNSNLSRFRTLKKREKIKRVSQTIFLNRTCFNGLFRVNSKGEFNVPIGSHTNPKILDEENIRKVSASIQHVKFYNWDYSRIRYKITGRTFVYFDPPYRPLPGSPSFTTYSKSGFNDENQRKLARICDELSSTGTQFLLSNSDPKNSDLTDTFFDLLYSKFVIERVEARRNINSVGKDRGTITELLVRNYEI